MKNSKVIRCKFCGYSTRLHWRGRFRQFGPNDAWESLVVHVELEHPDKFEEIQILLCGAV